MMDNVTTTTPAIITNNDDNVDKFGGLDDAFGEDKHHYLRIFYVVNVLVALVGILGNAIVLVVLLYTRSRSSESIAEWLLCNQSAVDLLTSLNLLVAVLIPEKKFVLSSHGPWEEFKCRVLYTQLILISLFSTSVYNLVALALNQYLQIVHPIFHRVYLKNVRASHYIVFIWLFAFGFNAAFVLPTSGIVDNVCQEFNIFPNQAVAKVAGVFIYLITYCTPLFLITYSFVRILIKLHRKRNGVGPLSQLSFFRTVKVGVLKSMALFCCVFVTCWSLNSIIHLIALFADFADAFYRSPLYIYSIVVLYGSCAINPFLYAARHRKFKDTVGRLCKRCKCKNEATCLRAFSTDVVKNSENKMQACHCQHQLGRLTSSRRKIGPM